MTKIDYVAQELNKIGLHTVRDEKATGFLEKVEIRKGGLLYQRDATVSSLLHEAGHLAIIPAYFRRQADNDIEEVIYKMMDYISDKIDKGENPDSPLIKAIMQCGETEATAWAYAFGKKIGLEDNEIITPEEYEGNGEGVLSMVSSGNYFGINGLRAAGMINSTKDWPHLKKWIQDEDVVDE